MAKKLFGFDKLISDALMEVETLLRLVEKQDVGFLGIVSPIEKLFHSTFMYRINSHCKAMDIDLAPMIVRAWVEPQETGRLYYFTQCVVFDGWPIDFVMGFRLGEETIRFAIECDGHDFHERTKEQAARDRSRDRELQKRHFRVFRFTGSEIYRDPLKCVDEVYKALTAEVSRLEADAVLKNWSEPS